MIKLSPFLVLEMYQISHKQLTEIQIFISDLFLLENIPKFRLDIALKIKRLYYHRKSCT